MSDARRVIERLEKLKAEVTRPEPFYQRHQREWQEISRRIIEQTLVALQPADVTAEVWHLKVGEIASRLTSTLLVEPEEVGVVFALAPRLQFDPSDSPGTFTLANLSIADVEEWVRKGRDKSSPDEPGKNLDERDAGKTDLQIAWRIMYALKLQKPGWERLMDVLREFVGLEAVEAIELLYPELLKAWLEQFSVVAARDWRNYVARLVAAV